MFSGLTNQVTSWIGAAKGEPQDEDVPAPPPNTNPTEQIEPAAATAELEQGSGLEQSVDEDGASKRKNLVSSLFESGMFSNVKGWLGSASIPSMPTMPSMPAMPSMPTMPAMPSIPSIPGLRKGAGDEGNVEGIVEQTEAAGAVSGDDEDKSRYISATEGADSHPASGGGTPTDEGQIGQVTTKVTQGAKHFGSFLYSAVNKAGAKIKETVKDNTILGEFNKEQEAFIKGQGTAESGQAPWVGHSNEQKIKDEIMGLSQDRRNFVRAPPAGVDFQFDYDTAYPTAIAIMAEDQALEKMRFELVPKIITEENFWRNYFYRVSLIIQAAELGTLGADGVGQASSEDVKLQATETNLSSSLDIVTPELGQNDVKSNEKKIIFPSANEKSGKLNIEIEEKSSRKTKAKQLSESEFVSDTFQTTETDLEEIKDGMRRLGIDSMTQQVIENNEEQWEKDLEAELQEYEVVTDGSGSGGGDGGGETSKTTIRNRSPSNNDWEQYADLIDETDDLK